MVIIVCCYCCCSVPKLCLILCNPMHCRMQHFSVLQNLWVSSNSCPSSWWCYLAILSSAAHFFFCHQSFSASGSLPMNWLFPSGGQSIGASTSTSVLPKDIQGWFPLEFTGFICLLSKGLLRIFSSTTIWKHQFFSTQPSLRSNSHICTWLLVKHNSD